jgi:hypothetical protein
VNLNSIELPFKPTNNDVVYEKIFFEIKGKMNLKFCGTGTAQKVGQGALVRNIELKYLKYTPLNIGQDKYIVT